MKLKIGVLWALLIISLVTLPHTSLIFAQDAAPFRAELTVRADQPKEVINRNIYGQFAEHLGRLIYGGLWVGEDAPIPNTRGLRNDGVAALKELQIPVLPRPGGACSDQSHCADGI